jgi:hypothetical protein
MYKTMKPRPTAFGGFVAVCIAAIIALLVTNLPWLAAALFLALSVYIFATTARAQGIKTALRNGLKRLLSW